MTDRAQADLFGTLFNKADLAGAILIGLALWGATMTALKLHRPLLIMMAYVSIAFTAAALWGATCGGRSLTADDLPRCYCSY